jgi:glycine/sarcosine N-methyltransferase
MSVRAFYDELAPLYHLVYEDWESSVARQGAALASLIAEQWGTDARVVLDAALGIGTQALGLLAGGVRVTGSDLSTSAVCRARREAAVRGLPLASLVADFRALPVRSATFDRVLVCDNAIPHLESEADIRVALAECFRCVREGGGCLAGAGRDASCRLAARPRRSGRQQASGIDGRRRAPAGQPACLPGISRRGFDRPSRRQ